LRRLPLLSRDDAHRQAAEASEEVLWVLKDVSFDIRRGERVAILLEIGTGFHQEFP